VSQLLGTDVDHGKRVSALPTQREHCRSAGETSTRFSFLALVCSDSRAWLLVGALPRVCLRSAGAAWRQAPTARLENGIDRVVNEKEPDAATVLVKLVQDYQGVIFAEHRHFRNLN
jgi:hypothetical protein